MVSTTISTSHIHTEIVESSIIVILVATMTHKAEVVQRWIGQRTMAIVILQPLHMMTQPEVLIVVVMETTPILILESTVTVLCTPLMGPVLTPL